MEKLSGFRRAVSLDLTDPEQTLAVIQAEQPTHVMHLAGISVVSQANQDVRKTWDVNTQGTLTSLSGLSRECRLTASFFAAVLKFTVAVSVRESHWEKMAALAMGSAWRSHGFGLARRGKDCRPVSCMFCRSYSKQVSLPCHIMRGVGP